MGGEILKETSTLVATHMDTQREREREGSWALGNGPLCTRVCPYPFFEATLLGAAPG